MMELTEITPKMHAAIELLERALQMYYDRAYFAAIHLAGAAEEILGGYVTRAGRESAFNYMHQGAARISSYIVSRRR